MEMKKLQDVVAILNGDRSSNYPSGDDFLTFGQPFVNAGHLQDGKVCYQKMDYISEIKLKSLSGAKLRKNDILICLRGTLGKYAYVEKDGGAPASSLAVLRAKENILPSYLFHMLGTHSFQSQIEIENNGSSQPNLSAKSVGEFIVPVPSLSAQADIANVLSEMDTMISILERKIAKKKGIKQGAMQELLTGKKRLPGFGGEWEYKTVGNIAPLQRGFDLPQSVIEDGCYPVVFSNGVNAYHKKAMVQGPGVVTGRSGTIGKVHYIDGPYWPHNTSLWVTDFKGNHPKYIYYMYQLINWIAYMTGSGVPTLNRNDVHSQSIWISTDVKEQKAIAEILSNMDSEIESLEQKLAKARQLKQGMMQQLLTGKIRLV